LLNDFRGPAFSDGLAITFQHGVLDRVGHVLPAGAIEARHDVDAHDLHEPVLHGHCVHGRVTNIRDSRDTAGTSIARYRVDSVHRLFRRSALFSEADELLRLLRRVADDTDAD